MSEPLSSDLVAIDAIRRGDKDGLRAVALRGADDGRAGGGVCLAERVRLAIGPLSRLRGLIGARSLPSGESLLLRPCSGIHTFFMRFAIDALFLDRQGVIVDSALELRPWRMVPLVAGAYATLELPAATVAPLGVARGDRVAFQRRR